MGSTPPIGYGGPTTKISGLDLKWFVCSKLTCPNVSLEPTCIYHFLIGLSLHDIRPQRQTLIIYVHCSQVYYDQFDTLVMEEMAKAWS